MMFQKDRRKKIISRRNANMTVLDEYMEGGKYEEYHVLKL